MPAWPRFILVSLLVLTGLSLFILAATSTDSTLFERWFPALLMVNRAIAVMLFGIVVAMTLRLLLHLRNHEFGANMTGHLSLRIAALSLVPCLLIYFVSSVFISRSIDSWFDVRVEKALDSGVTITRGILIQHQLETEVTARQIAQELANIPAPLIMPELLKAIEGHTGLEALVFMPNGTAVAAAGSRVNVLMPDLPTNAQIQTVKSTGLYSVIDGDAFENIDALREGKLSVRVIVPIPGSTSSSYAGSPHLFGQSLYLQLIEPVADETAKNAAVLVAGYRDYQTLILSRASLQNVYNSTLFLVMLLAVLGAFALSLTFAKRMVSPLQQLEQGTRRVADGNFAPIREFSGGSEVNVLTKSFNQMIRDLAESRHVIDDQRRRAEQAQAFLERVLTNITSGVLVLDQANCIVTANAAATQILGESICKPGINLETTEPELFLALRSASLSLGISPSSASASLEFELSRPSGCIPLFLKLSSMPLAMNESGLVIVFDDATKILEAQRANAWGEVARRLAHEIKNPLTPIQLAAERLSFRLGPRLEPKDAEMLERTVNTITTQVNALKQMVNDFREYAKLPEAKLAPLDLNTFLQSIAQFYDDAGTSLELRLEPSLPMIEGDAAQLRQVIHNLITNSIDAAEGDIPHIVIETSQIVTDRGVSAVRFHLHDSGIGFSENILERAFEPYVTTKETGTGLGLPMVKKIIDEHRALIHLSNRMDRSGTIILGAQIDILFVHLAPDPSARSGIQDASLSSPEESPQTDSNQHD